MATSTCAITPPRRSGEDQSVADLRAEIARTLGDLDATLDSICDRLSPGTLKSQAKNAIKRAATDKARSVAAAATAAATGVASQCREVTAVLGRSAKHDPLPATLAGLGTLAAFTGWPWRLLRLARSRRARSPRPQHMLLSQAAAEPIALQQGQPAPSLSTGARRGRAKSTLWMTAGCLVAWGVSRLVAGMAASAGKAPSRDRRPSNVHTIPIM